MKITRLALAAAAAMLVPAAAFSFSLEDIKGVGTAAQFSDKIDGGLKDFTEQLASSIPQAATQQNVWADAWIGNLFPSLPPHFGGGFNMAVTHIDTSGLSKAAGALGIGGIKDSYYFPCFAADVRVGGLFLPFDVGFAVMKTGTMSTDAMGCDLDLDFFTIGADVRYALLEGGLILPKLSVGVGYFYNSGSFGASESHAEAKIDYSVHTLYGQVQASKDLFIFTPFVGLRALVSKYDNEYEWKVKDSALVTAASAAGYKLSGTGGTSSSSFDFGGIQPQLYAGVGVNLLIFQATLSVSADLRHIADSGLWSGAFSLRAHL